MSFWILALLAAAPTGELPPPPAVPDSARGETAIEDGRPHVFAYLISDVERVTAGETLRAGILYRMDPGWHIYWQNPGEAAIPTDLSIETLQGRSGDIQWPMPSVFRESNGFITTFGYAGQVLLFTEIEITDERGLLELSARSDFLACKVECVPGRVELTRTLPLGTSTVPSAQEALFEYFAERVPRNEASVAPTVALRVSPNPVGPSEKLRAWVEVTCERCQTLELGAPVADAFVPRAIVGMDRPEPIRVYAIDGGLSLELNAKTGVETRSGQQDFAGVLALVVDGEPMAIEVSKPLQRAGRSGSRGPPSYASPVVADAQADAAAPAVAASAPVLPLWQVAVFALLGGLLLNLMPCVLPVLAIKVVSFAELAHRDRRDVLPHAAAYAVAVVGSMLALAGLVVALKAAGTSIGWGFQFQSPLFVALVGGLLVAFALNLFGVFEVTIAASGLGSATDRATGIRRSFLEGILAVVLATPCTAPLLGSAVGFALSQSAAVVFLVFGLIGVGLASPFVVLTLVPGAQRFVPRPGTWMITLKHLLAFALLGSAVWLAWIVGRGFGPDAMASTLAFFVAVAAAAWALGRWQLGTLRARRLSASLAATLLMVAGVVFLRFEPSDLEAAGLRWRTFDSEAIGRDLASGKPVFVNFTADWCITCKVNERTVLTQPEIQTAANLHDIALYKADWTRRDPEIERALARYGKAGVPAYVLYSPSAPEKPVILPELLTVAVLAEAFKTVAQ